MSRDFASDSYRCRRAWLERYFDRTAAAAWTELTSEKSVGAIRAARRVSSAVYGSQAMELVGAPAAGA